MEKETFYKKQFEDAERKEGVIQKEVHRGDVFFYAFTKTEMGSEQNGTGNSRPCVIVSNEKNNLFSQTVTIVPMTSKTKTPLPTHVHVDIGIVSGTVMAEQVTTISKDRLLNFCGEIDGKTMLALNNALSVQLDIRTSQKQDKEDTSASKSDDDLCDEEILRKLKAAEDEVGKYKYILLERFLKHRGA